MNLKTKAFLEKAFGLTEQKKKTKAKTVTSFWPWIKCECGDLHESSVSLFSPQKFLSFHRAFCIYEFENSTMHFYHCFDWLGLKKRMEKSKLV